MAGVAGTGEDRVSTGVAGLDGILRGGLTPARMYLLEGSPGTGKTTFGLRFLMSGAQDGEAGLYITPSETSSELSPVWPRTDGRLMASKCRCSAMTSRRSRRSSPSTSRTSASQLSHPN